MDLVSNERFERSSLRPKRSTLGQTKLIGDNSILHTNVVSIRVVLRIGEDTENRTRNMSVTGSYYYQFNYIPIIYATLTQVASVLLTSY